MIDFAGMHRRAKATQEREGLGTDNYALSQDVFALLNEIKLAFDERDEANVQHATIAAKYRDAASRLNRISLCVAGYQNAHAKDSVDLGQDRAAIEGNGKYVGPVPSAVPE